MTPDEAEEATEPDEPEPGEQRPDGRTQGPGPVPGAGPGPKGPDQGGQGHGPGGTAGQPGGGQGGQGGAGGEGGLPMAGPQVERQQKQMKLQERIAEALDQIDHKVIVMSGKGGVGKSTVAVNLAAYLAKKGRKVGLVDLDLTNPDDALMLGVDDAKLLGREGRIEPVRVNENLSLVSTAFMLEQREKPVIWRGPIKVGVISQFLGDVNWGKLDYLVVDLPPGTSDEPLSIAQNIRDADGTIIVTTPQEVSLLDIRKSIQFANTVNLPILGVVENMANTECPHCGEPLFIFGRGGGEKAAKEFDLNFLGSVPFEPRVVTMSDTGLPFAEDEDLPAAKAFAEIADKVMKLCEEM